jgi:hypothetical protein
MSITLHHGDLPAGYDPGASIAIDTETLGLAITDPIWEIAAIRREPDGTETTYTYALAQVTKDATGVYSKNIPADACWTWPSR